MLLVVAMADTIFPGKKNIKIIVSNFIFSIEKSFPWLFDLQRNGYMLEKSFKSLSALSSIPDTGWLLDDYFSTALLQRV